MNELETLIVLNMVPDLGSVRLRGLLEKFGSPQNVLAAPQKKLRKVFGIGEVISRNIVEVTERTDLKKEFDLMKECGVRIITMFDRDYPSNLKNIYDPPILLYVKGDLQPEDNIAVAIVGSRGASYYGISTTERLAWELVDSGFTIVSGMARGIDTASHRGALKAKGRTIAVLGSGLNFIYPPENKKLAEKIAASGAVVSEFPMQTSPDRQNFPMRNRIISGLSLGVVVVEAARYSGSLITANMALEQGREVFAVPGSARALYSQGTHRLLRQGAKLVETAEDVVEELEPAVKPYQEHLKKAQTKVRVPGGPGVGRSEGPATHRLKEAQGPQKRTFLLKNLDADEQKVFGLLSGEPIYIDELSHRCGMVPQVVSSLLSRLEIKGLVKQFSGKMFVRKQT